MTIKNYIHNINRRYQQGNATEHTFRGDLQHLLETLMPDTRATNEPQRQACGAPDFILTRKDIPVGFIEAKDIGDNDLEGKRKSGNKEQFDRYKQSLNNLVFTDYLDFHFYRDGEFETKIAIGHITQKGIVPLTENFKQFENHLRFFSINEGYTIKNPKKLAKMMAGKARLLSDVIGKALTSDEDNQENSTLKEQMEAFKKVLIHDITPQGFADVYAQTIAYGMFAARLHDPDLDTFTRQEAAELIPKSNPFLRRLFGYIAGPDIDDRIKWIVDNLAEIFLACDVEEILKTYGKSTQMEDPIIHFYETFLSEYDPALRKSRGVWYTPAPVVSFIVRAVDDVLKTEFGLSQGLADTSQTNIIVNTQTPDKRSSTGYKQTEQQVHKVQILDPATGTGTFLAEVIKQVHRKFEGQQGIWSKYVETHLLPRLNGFELLMASYAMAHLQLDLLLKETGFRPTKEQRTRVYLTNSLEEHHPDTGTLFANWLSTEANEANRIKRDTPVMCVIGNPPYSAISSNNGEWISSLIEDYKYVDGVHFNERKHWLNDDYVKFLRYGQHYIEKNGSGVLAFINPHGFLDNPTFRGMRWHLLKTYDKIYTIDLHGNSKKKETAPDGSPDVNVFDIQQGVSINIFIKTGKKKTNELGNVFHYDLYGMRDLKYDFLSVNSLASINFNEVKYSKPFFYFIPKSEKGRDQYEKGFGLDEFFKTNVTGIVTARDSVVIDTNKKELLKRIEKFTDQQYSDSEIRSWLFAKKKSGKYLAGDSRGWKLDLARSKIANNIHHKLIKDINYRPFDIRNIYYSPDMVDWGRESLMYHLIEGENVSLVFSRQATDENWTAIQVSKNMIDNRFHFSYKGIPIQAPLYLYPEPTEQTIFDKPTERTPNLNPEIVKQIEKELGLSFTPEKETGNLCFANNNDELRDEFKQSFAPIDLLDYIYAVLHSPSYREKYKEFLKIDFPRVPYPNDADTFWQLVHLGSQLREIHLLESPIVSNFITSYPMQGTNEITTGIARKDWQIIDKENHLGRIWINDTQYFDNIPLAAWEFYIGGYQPAQKWLKDRRNKTLEFDDILHYQKIIVALAETERLMREIDLVSVKSKK